MWKEIREHEIKQYPIGTRVTILSSGVYREKTISAISGHYPHNDSGFRIEQDGFWGSRIFSAAAWRTHKVLVEVDILEDDIKQLEKKYNIKITYETKPKLVAPGTILRMDGKDYMLVQTKSYQGMVISLSDGNRMSDVPIEIQSADWDEIANGHITYGAHSDDVKLEGFEILWKTTPNCYIKGKTD